MKGFWVVLALVLICFAVLMPQDASAFGGRSRVTVVNGGVGGVNSFQQVRFGAFGNVRSFQSFGGVGGVPVGGVQTFQSFQSFGGPGFGSGVGFRGGCF